MKIKVKLILVLLISIIGKECYSQDIDTSKIIMNAKLAILEINDKVVSEKFIEGYIKYKPKYRFLESKGFSKDYIFFEINAEPYFDYDNADTIGEVIEINNYFGDRKSTRLNSSHVRISYAVFCLKKKTYTHE